MFCWCGVIYLTLFVLYANASESPVVGVLTQESYLVRNAYPDSHSFLVASYVKLLESSGARVMPIWIGQNNNYYENVVKYTNGIVFPGGGTYFNETGGYGEAAKQLFEAAVRTNERGVHYPLWGICLGMQALAFAAMNGTDIRENCYSKNVALPLEFAAGYRHSKMFSRAPEQLLEDVSKQNLTFNNHQFCLLEKTLKEKGFLKDWRIVSRNKDDNGLEFVSSMEHSKYPFYGVQYHPEKNPYEFKINTVPHSDSAIHFTQYLSNFFVHESKNNNNSFPDKSVERDVLIYNYTPVYSIKNTSYEQLYLFKKENYVVLF